MQNGIVTVSLLLWPAIVVVLFLTLSYRRALLWALFGAQLFLPADGYVKFSGVPQFDKVTVPNIAAFACCFLFLRRRTRPLRHLGLVEALVLMFVGGAFLTSELNGDVVVYATGFIPSLDGYDGLSALIYQILILIPFYLGRRYLSREIDNKDLFRVLVVGMLIYSPLMLFEVRMSPQLQAMIYGFAPGDFAQEVRNEGFRPTVFMGHGLVTAFFTMTATLAAFVLVRSGEPGWVQKASACFLSLMLLLCKSFGALLYGLLSIPLALFAKPQAIARVSVVLALFAFAYPALRLADLVPTGTILQLVSLIDADRAQSLEVRFLQERQLLDRALERPWFGWGRFGRSRVRDAESGKDDTLSDGRWIITLGQFGIVGFLSEFGLLCLPILRVTACIKQARSSNEAYLLAVLALALAINMIELLPNSTLTPWTWLMSGCLLARCELISASRPQTNALLSKRRYTSNSLRSV